MTWTSNRKAELPPDWQAIRRRVLARDGHRCTAILPTSGDRCPEKATDVHHVGDKHDHSDGNLTSACKWHHDRATSAQGNRARRRVSQKRPPEKHPGVIE